MKLAIFDFDGTLFPKDTLPFLARQWRKQKYSRFKLLAVLASIATVFARYKLALKHRQREAALVEVMRRFTRLFSGMEESDLKRFFECCAKKIADQLDAAVVEEVKRAKTSGFHTVLLSGCYEYLLELVAEFLSIDTVIGTKLDFSAGRLDLSRKLDVVYGADKVCALIGRFGEGNIDWNNCIAYADSYSDLPLLKKVGSPVAVGPDSALEAFTKKAGWRVIKAENS